MTLATRDLPPGYRQTGELSLKGNPRLAVVLNAAAVLAVGVTFVLVAGLAAAVRPGLVTTSGTITLPGMVVVAALMMALIVVHEVIHGLFFWAYTRERPVFALHLTYAYAGAPHWYIPARRFAVIGLAPLVVIDAAGCVLLLVAPLDMVLLVVVGIALSTGGSVGDLLAMARLARLSPDGLANDTGDVMTFFERPSAVLPG